MFTNDELKLIHDVFLKEIQEIETVLEYKEIDEESEEFNSVVRLLHRCEIIFEKASKTHVGGIT